MYEKRKVPTMTPEGKYYVLTSHVINSQRDIVVFDGLVVESFMRGKHQATKEGRRVTNRMSGQ